MGKDTYSNLLQKKIFWSFKNEVKQTYRTWRHLWIAPWLYYTPQKTKSKVNDHIILSKLYNMLFQNYDLSHQILAMKS